MLGATSASTDELLSALVDELQGRGFAVHELEQASQEHEFVGIRLVGKQRLLCHKPKRFWRLWYALGDFISQGCSTTNQMQKVVGHLVNNFSLCRCMLAVLDQVYLFMDRSDDKVRRFSPALLAELTVARGLLIFAVHPAGLSVH